MATLHDNNSAQWQRIKKMFRRSTDTCAICGLPLDWSIKTPHPMSGEIDHIIPLSKGGEPYALENLQASHRCCNKAKSNKLTIERRSNDRFALPVSRQWNK